MCTKCSLHNALTLTTLCLQAWKLNDASSGGLSSFNLIMLVMAYLIGPKKTSLEAQGGIAIAIHPQYHLDLHWHLHGLFQMYGRDYDYERDAIDLQQVSKIDPYENLQAGRNQRSSTIRKHVIEKSTRMCR